MDSSNRFLPHDSNTAQPSLSTLAMVSDTQPVPTAFFNAQTFPLRRVRSFLAQPSQHETFRTPRAFRCRGTGGMNRCPSLNWLPRIAPTDTHIRVVVHDATTPKIFVANKTQLCDASGYFRSALSGRWETNNDGVIEIEDDPTLFEQFLNYATTGKLSQMTQPNLHIDLEYIDPRHYRSGSSENEWPVRLDRRDHTKVASDAPRLFIVDPNSKCFLLSDYEAACKYGHLSFEKLTELYIFADRREAPGLADHAISIMLEKMSLEHKLPIQVINQLLENTAQAESGLMFKMLTDIAARFVAVPDMIKHADDLPVEFIISVVQRQREHIEEERELEAKRRTDEKEHTGYYRQWDGRRAQNGMPKSYPRRDAPEEQTFRSCKWHLHK